jgi:hypothetical protein
MDADARTLGGAAASDSSTGDGGNGVLTASQGRESSRLFAAGTNRVRRAFALALLLCGCASGGDPVVISHAGSMVTIEQPRSVPQKDATPVARATCGGPATLLSKICTDLPCAKERLIYWCR